MQVPSDIERNNLETHVVLCHHRYVELEKRLTKIEGKMYEMHEDLTQSNASLSKVLITTAGTIVAGVLSTIVVVIVALL